MMDTATLLAELDASDAALDGVSHADIARRTAIAEIKRGNQQLREALSRIAELEAVVVPLERLLGVWTAFVLSRGEEYCVSHPPHNDYRAATLSEALAAAIKAMECDSGNKI